MYSDTDLKRTCRSPHKYFPPTKCETSYRELKVKHTGNCTNYIGLFKDFLCNSFGGLTPHYNTTVAPSTRGLLGVLVRP